MPFPRSESLSFGRRLRRKVLQYALETLHWHHRIPAVYRTEDGIARAVIEVALLEHAWGQSLYNKTFAGPGAAGAAPTPHHEDRSAGWQEGARAQATYWSECRLHGHSVHDAVGHRTRRLHHAHDTRWSRHRPRGEAGKDGGSTSSTRRTRLMAAAT